jgi:hypothetical protein
VRPLAALIPDPEARAFIAAIYRENPDPMVAEWFAFECTFGGMIQYVESMSQREVEECRVAAPAVQAGTQPQAPVQGRLL